MSGAAVTGTYQDKNNLFHIAMKYRSKRNLRLLVDAYLQNNTPDALYKLLLSDNADGKSPVDIAFTEGSKQFCILTLVFCRNLMRSTSSLGTQFLQKYQSILIKRPDYVAINSGLLYQIERMTRQVEQWRLRHPSIP